MTNAPLTAEEVIGHLGLKPHPAGGWFRETFRDETGPQGRAHSTAILFLLKAGEASRWTRSMPPRCGTGMAVPRCCSK